MLSRLIHNTYGWKISRALCQVRKLQMANLTTQRQKYIKDWLKAHGKKASDVDSLDITDNVKLINSLITLYSINSKMYLAQTTNGGLIILT